MSPTYQERCRAIPTVLRIVLFAPFALVGLGIGGTWWWSGYFFGAGPYGWLASVQVSLFGGFFPVYTGFFLTLFTILVCIIPPGLIQYLLVRMEIFPLSAMPPAGPPRLPPLPEYRPGPRFRSAEGSKPSEDIRGGSDRLPPPTGSSEHITP